MPTRRSFLAAASAAVVASAAPRLAAEARTTPLPIPPLLDARAQRAPLALKVQEGRTQFLDAQWSPTLGYNGTYLGPTIRVHRGDESEIHVTNALRDDTTVHWHGLVVPGDLDGGPHQVIRPGETWRPRLPVRQPAATLFYHSHVHHRTAEQVYFGLAGMLIISDKDEQSLGLPSDYGVDDLPLVLQDRALDGQGRLMYRESPMTVMHGMRGDTLLVNGAAEPVAAVPSGLVRLRLVNGANARIFHVAFGDRRTFWWIGTDSGLLEQAVERDMLTLSPGERAEVLVDFSKGGPVDLVTGPDGNAPMMGMMGRKRGPTTSQRLMRFEPDGRKADRTVPPRLVHEQAPDAADTIRRRLVLTMGMPGMGGGMGGMGGMRGGGMGGMGGMRSPGGGMAMHGIDGRPFDMERIDQRVRLGDTEIWEVSGDMMWHPFHVHGVRFKVLRRNGKSPGVEDQGWKDTVLVREPVELLIRFTEPSRDAPYMYHCHILEHEDHGMMGQFTVA